MRAQLFGPAEKLLTHQLYPYLVATVTGIFLKIEQVGVIAGGRMNTLKWRKKVTNETGTEMYCQNPWRENKEENNHPQSKLLNPHWRQKQPVQHHLSSPCTFDTERWSFVSQLNNEYRIFYSSLICFKWVDNWNSNHVSSNGVLVMEWVQYGGDLSYINPPLTPLQKVEISNASLDL